MGAHAAIAERDRLWSNAMGTAFPGDAAAFPDGCKLCFDCPSCKQVHAVEEKLVVFTATMHTYVATLSVRKCPHCGVEFSGLHPAVQCSFSGIALTLLHWTCAGSGLGLARQVLRC